MAARHVSPNLNTQQDFADMLAEVQPGVDLVTRGLLQHADVMVLMSAKHDTLGPRQ